MLSNECQWNNQLLHLLDLCVFYSSSKKNTIYKINLYLYCFRHRKCNIGIVQPCILAVGNIANMNSIIVLSGFIQEEFFKMLNKWYLDRLFCYGRKKIFFFFKVYWWQKYFYTFLKFGDCSFSHLICRKEEHSKSKTNFWQCFLDTPQKLIII